MSETTEKVEYFGASKFEIAMISLTQVAANLFNVLMTMVSYLATGGWGMAVMVASQITASMRILDAVTDPIVSWFAPRVRTRFGVATPLVFLGWILEMVSIILMFNVMPNTQSVPLFIVLYVVNVFGYTFLNKAIMIYKLNDAAYVTLENVQINGISVEGEGEAYGGGKNGAFGQGDRISLSAECILPQDVGESVYEMTFDINLYDAETDELLLRVPVQVLKG